MHVGRRNTCIRVFFEMFCNVTGLLVLVVNIFNDSTLETHLSVKFRSCLRLLCLTHPCAD